MAIANSTYIRINKYNVYIVLFCCASIVVAELFILKDLLGVNCHFFQVKEKVQTYIIMSYYIAQPTSLEKTFVKSFKA